MMSSWTLHLDSDSVRDLRLTTAWAVISELDDAQEQSGGPWNAVVDQKAEVLT